MATATVCLTCSELGCESTNETQQGPTWGATPEKRSYFRCQPCNSNRSRLTKALNSDDDDKQDFQKLSADKKAFKERNKDKLSENMAESLHVIVEEGWEAYEAEEFGMDGNVLDKDDMDEKYKNKPEQLENICKNARKNICPTRGVALWEDPKWCSTQKTGSRTRQGVKRRTNQYHGNFFNKNKAKQGQ